MFHIFSNPDKHNELIRRFEKSLRGYQLGFIQLKDNKKNSDYLKKIYISIQEYNDLVDEAFDEINIYYNNEDLEHSKELLKIEV